MIWAPTVNPRPALTSCGFHCSQKLLSSVGHWVCGKGFDGNLCKIFYYCQSMKLRERNVFKCVCHSVRRGVVYLRGKVGTLHASRDM